MIEFAIMYGIAVDDKPYVVEFLDSEVLDRFVTSPSIVKTVLSLFIRLVYRR